MTLEEVLAALALPPQALLAHRVPKTLLVEHGAPTAADKRQIENGIEELRWVATLKPTTVGIAAYEDDSREVLELAVLALRLRPDAKAPRLIELIHRAIPYHLLLIAEAAPDQVLLSLADKRWAQNERNKVVLDGDLVSCDLHTLTDDVLRGMLGALALPHTPRANLYALYRGWIDALLAAQAASRTGVFAPPESPQRAAERREAVKTCAALEGRMASLRAAAAKEKQVARQVEMNLELKRLRADYDAAMQRL